MRTSQFLLATLKESPSDAVTVSHKLMLRSGMIRQLASGLYTWLPLGLRVLRKVEYIVRLEMNKTSAQEILMPFVQPADLWQESGRWDEYGPELLRIKDRHLRDFCAGPTHEEVITDLVRGEISSYKQLPINFYQIQTKFRDEIRPRFGLMRAREFIMKDAYSFHMDDACLQRTYQTMYETYVRIFNRLGLNFCAVEADTGSIGGNKSHEFHVLADSGEDAIAISDSSNYAANVELAPSIVPNITRANPTANLTLVDTPNIKTIADLVSEFNLPIEKTVKTLVVKATNGGLIALVIRGDHTLNAIKAANLPEVLSPLQMASADEIKQATGAYPGSLGMINLAIPYIVDHHVAVQNDFVIGANIDDKHYFGVNFGRDLPEPYVADLREVTAGDPSPCGTGTLQIHRGIEVGHIFQLGTKYSKALNCAVMDEAGKSHILTMGCYGLGVSRVVAAAIEQNYDEQGIIWNDVLAPFNIVLIPLKYIDPQIKKITDNLYIQLQNLGFDVLLDDRDKKTTAGAKFADMELIGIPHRIVISEKTLAEQAVEYKARTSNNKELIKLADLTNFLQQQIKI